MKTTTMKAGDRIKDGLFFSDAKSYRGNGTIMEIHPIDHSIELILPEMAQTGFFYAVVKWDNPIPEECCVRMPIDDDNCISEEYLEDLKLVEEQQ